MTLKTKILVHFDDADPGGIVFFANYLKLAHRALEEALPKAGIPWEKWFGTKDYGVPLRHIEADYQKPIRPGTFIEVEQTLTKLGTSSVTFESLMKDDQGNLCAKVTHTHVFVDMKNKTSIQIPGEIRKVLEA